MEKIAGVCLVKKLRYIQLYEADFNFFQQFIFGRETINLLTDKSFLPEEHFNKKGSTVEYAKFDKTLTEDLSKQARHLFAVVSVDTAQCYARVNHMTMTLLWHALIGTMDPILVLLTCMQHMILVQCTGFGDSTTFLDGGQLSKYLI